MPSVSVIVPAYNVGRYLERCLLSLDAQTSRDLEVIVVDDGSTDDSLAIAERFATNSPAVFRVVRQQNRGLGPARNRGFSEARGEFVAFVDGDDWVDNVFCVGSCLRARETGADVVFFGYRVVDERGRVLETNGEMEATVIGPREAIVGLSPMAWNKLYRTDLLRNAGLCYPSIYHEDMSETYRILSYARRVAKCDRILYNYSRRGDSITAHRSGINSRDVLSACRILLEQAASRERFCSELSFQAFKFLEARIVEWRKVPDAWASDCVEQAERLLASMPETIEDNPYYRARQKEQRNSDCIDASGLGTMSVRLLRLSTAIARRSASLLSRRRPPS